MVLFGHDLFSSLGLQHTAQKGTTFEPLGRCFLGFVVLDFAGQLGAQRS